MTVISSGCGLRIGKGSQNYRFELLVSLLLFFRESALLLDVVQLLEFFGEYVVYEMMEKNSGDPRFEHTPSPSYHTERLKIVRIVNKYF